MIRPTETWQPQATDLDARPALDARRQVLTAGDYAPPSSTPLPQLPQPSLARDLRYIQQFLQTSLPLWFADQLVVILAVSTAWLLSAGAIPLLALAWPLGVALTLAHWILGLYPGVGVNAQRELQLTTQAATVIGAVYTLTTIAVRGELGAPGWPYALLYGVCLLLLPVARQIVRQLVSGCRWWSQPAWILGGGPEGAAAYGNLLRYPQLGLRPVVLVSRSSGPLSDAEWELVPAHQETDSADISRVFWGVVAMPHVDEAAAAELLDRLALSFPHLLVVPPEISGGRSWHGAQRWGELLVARIDVRLLLPGPKLLKRFSDLVLTTVALAMTCPLALAIIVLVKLGSPGPSLYRHERIGRDGRRFRAWKFRTMSVDADQILQEYLARHPDLQAEWDETHKLRRDPRVTGIGWLLRKTSLDELPQLWNVLVGEMSLVGPRPIVQAEVAKYDGSFGLYTQVRPGITGLWQINGRNNTTYAERVQYDSQYVRNWSLWLDCYILARTIKTVLLTEGAY